MKHVKDLSIENARMHDLLDRYFASRRTLKSSAAETSFHLDEDSLATFIEGTLSRRESEPVVAHLVECRFCLHKTAELVRLDLELAEVNHASAIESSAQPVSISTVLSDLFSKIFGTNDSAVFAHEEKDEEVKDKSDEDKKV
jgi:hypothetical protein